MMNTKHRSSVAILKKRMNESGRRSMRVAAMVGAAGVWIAQPHVATAATIGWNQTGAGTYDYNDPANWVGGNINGLFDASLSITGAQAVTFGTDTTLTTPIVFNHNATGNFDILMRADGTGDRVLTLGGDVTLNSALNRTTLVGSSTNGQRLTVDLGGATRTFDVTNSGNKVLNLRNGITGGSEGVIKAGSGTLQIESSSTYSGATTINGGTFWYGAGGRTVNSDVIVNTGGTLRFDSSGSGNTSLARTKSVTLNGGSLTGSAASSTSVNTNDLMGALSLGAGGSTVMLAPIGTRHMRMTADSFTREAGGTVLFRGTGFGVNTLASNTVNATNFVFTTAPTLTGTPGGSGTTVGIIKGAYAGTTNSSNGEGLVTYDSTYGVRLLSGSEYATSIIDGQTTLDNVRLSNASGVVSNVTVDAATTINSLSLNVSGVTSPINVGGTGTITLGSGTIFAQSVSPATTGAEMTVNNTINLNGQQGVIFYNTVGSSNGSNGAKLFLNGPITNSGGNGVVVAGSGVVEFSGAGVNTFTGPTVMNSGLLRLTKSVDNSAVVGDLVINGGTVQNTGNEIADTSDIIINGGSLLQKGGATNSGSGASETFRDLTVNGGSVTSGASGSGSTTNMRNASIAGGSWTPTRAHTVNMSGSLSVSGGTINVAGTSDGSSGANINLAGDLNITNTASGVYAPITLGSSTGAGNPGRITLSGDLTFTGNGTNANTVAITTTAAPKLGALILNGTRTLNVGDGAATHDLELAVALTNGTSAGGLTKTGLGTLDLTGASTYTGPTNVSAGTLLVNGSLAADSTMNVNAGGTLGGNGTVGGATSITGTLAPGASAGLLSFGSSLGLGGTSIFEVDGLARGVVGGYDATNVAGELTYGGVLNVVFSDTFAIGSTFDLFDFATQASDFAAISLTGDYVGTLLSLGNGNWYGSTGSQAFTFDGSSGVLQIVDNVAVPEPTAIGLLVGAAGMMLRRRRAV
ncbi:MAG TPA: autotransporter-associated beta strand repeat-containing protein [Tepidisphaeraceae bacterium]|jgi:autotransporter-associated beta strand protein|nr:autotransporter-associated beta strand repeat-containing protein [Tepidisphaeraceae bacterium]